MKKKKEVARKMKKLEVKSHGPMKLNRSSGSFGRGKEYVRYDAMTDKELMRGYGGPEREKLIKNRRKVILGGALDK